MGCVSVCGGIEVGCVCSSVVGVCMTIWLCSGLCVCGCGDVAGLCVVLR
jgi:hypothetical protein